MPIYVTVILDSGCFLPIKKGENFTEIGYFSSSDSVSDIRIVADGKEVAGDKQLNLKKNRRIEVRHTKAGGEVNKSGVKGDDGFHDKLLHLKDLYGNDMKVSRSKFDTILRFDSGLFSAAMVKPRMFRKHSKQANGELVMMDNEPPLEVTRPIAHNVHVHYELKRGDKLELVSNGKVLWSSENAPAKGRIDVEVIADNSTVERFFVEALRDDLAYYFMPNNGDPPPMCPEPPCQP